MRTPTVRFVGRGHPDVRATHTKTLELTPDPDITGRATCVVAVGTQVTPAAPMAGWVRLTVSAAGTSFTLEALANPLWRPGGPTVIRRSPVRLPGTFATRAGASSADLPRDLVAALASPDTVVEVDVEPVRGERASVVLAWLDPATGLTPALQAEQDAADAVVGEDATARRLVEHTGLLDDRQPNRTLAVAASGLPGAAVADLLADPAVDIEVIGLPAALAAAAASPGRGPVLVADEGQPAAEVLRTAPAADRVVVRVEPDDVPALVELANGVRNTASAVLVQEGVPPLRVVDGVVPDLARNASVYCCFPSTDDEGALDPQVRAAVRGLLADGTSTRTVARALAELTGLSRRAAYDLALGMGADVS